MSSGSVRDLRRRIQALGTTEQLTRAMRTVAASKYSRIQQKVRRFTPYSEAAFELLQTVGAGEEEERRTVKKVCYVCFTASRGLCGSYNSDITRYLLSLLSEEQREYSVVFCGRWGMENARPNGIKNVIRGFAPGDLPEFAQARELTDYLRQLYRSGEADEVIFVYQEFHSALSQTPVSSRLLPIVSPEGQQSAEPIFQPAREELLPALRSQCLEARTYGVMLTAAEGALGSMMNAMRQASENAEEMIADLTLEMNRLRQQAITTEMLELASGKDTLEDSEVDYE